MSRAEVIAEVSADRVRSHVEHITTQIPSRLAGSENGRRMAEYSLRMLTEAGLDTRIHELPGLVSFPEPAAFRVLQPREISIEANTFGHSVPTLPDGLAGELVDVGSGGFEDYAHRNVLGRIVLCELSYQPARHEKQRIAALHGAIGCVMMNWGHAENTAVPFGSVKPAWGNPTPEVFAAEMPTLPCIGISRTAGLQLRDMLRSGPLRVWLRASVENSWRPVQITVGEIARASEDFVLVGGHQDSWFGPQATDNAAGSACMIELARVFAQHRSQLRRGLVFGFWTAHETGTMVGSSWFADRYWDRLRQHAVAYLQIDQPGCIGAAGWATSSNVELRGFHQAAERELLPGRVASWHRASKGGDASFFGLGIPMLVGHGAYSEAELKASALATLGWWHHSLENTIDKLDWESMQDHLRIYAAWLWDLCTTPILPLTFVPVADQFLGRLAELRTQEDPVGLAGVVTRAEAFRAAAASLDAATLAWRERYDDARSDHRKAADHLNDCLKRLSRVLVPLASTAKGTYGHDPYGYTPQGSMVPGLFELPSLELLAPGGEERWMLEVKIMRERNRVADALGDCTLLIERSLLDIGRLSNIDAR